MKRATIEISGNAILKWLQVDDMDVFAAQWDWERGVLQLAVTHPSLPEVVEGMTQDVIMPFYRIHSCGHICELGEHRAVTRDNPIVTHGTVLDVPLSTSAEVLHG